MPPTRLFNVSTAGCRGLQIPILPYCITIRKDDVVMKKAKIDHEDGGLVYEVEFFHKGLEYEYDIDPRTGAILKVGKERD